MMRWRIVYRDGGYTANRVVMLDEVLLWMFARARISYSNCYVGVPEMGK